MPVAPFPWHALPRVAASEATAMASLRAAHPRLSAASIAATLTELVGHAVVVEPRRRAMSPIARIDLGSRGTCTVLARATQLLAIEIEAELALAIVGTLAGARGLPKIARGRRVEPEVAGALASVVQHVARAVAGDDIAVVGIDVTPDDLRARLVGSSPIGDGVVAIDCAVRLGALKAIARVVSTVPAPATGSNATSPLGDAASSAVLATLGDLPLALPVVLASGWAPRRDLALLVGDVVLVDGLARDGRCALAEPGAARGISATMLDPGRLRLDGARVELAAEPSPVESTESAPMNDQANPTGETMEVPAFGEGSVIADVLADMPIEVRVEAGVVTMPARAWAAMGIGDVVVLDRRVGESVMLRVGGKTIGRGELVDVDGSLGVRLVERSS